MKKPRYLLSWAGIIFLCMVFFYSTDIMGESRNIDKVSPQTRADVIKIDILNSFGKLEKAPVEFLHEAHTKALIPKNKDCKTCHLTKNDNIFPKFKRITDTNRIEVMNIYHEGCISCHGEMKLVGEKAGPVECDSCHREKIQYSSSRQPMGFDKSLHFRHSKAHEKKCEQCHHEYDEENKKLFYAKGKEGTCRYCHKLETQDNRLSMRMSSHIACINCHINNQEKNPIDLPVNCTKCHDSSAQKNIKKLAAVPRIERDQPDLVMIKTGNADLDAPMKNRMDFVPFNHKFHEETQDTCRKCHHGDISSCNKCHTLEGAEDGNYISLEKAMHKEKTEQSCRGCHEINQNDKNCAGCHIFLSNNKKQDDSSCLECHMKRKPAASNIKLEDSKVAGMLLDSRKPVTATYLQKDIPEKVVIKELSDQYEPAEFPHRKIVNTIVDNIKDNKLAMYFHDSKGTICQGCHHNSPASIKPTRCGNCHGKDINEDDVFKPSIKGAYHIQCIECHTNMEVDKVGCTDCHKEKKK